MLDVVSFSTHKQPLTVQTNQSPKTAAAWIVEGIFLNRMNSSDDKMDTKQSALFWRKTLRINSLCTDSAKNLILLNIFGAIIFWRGLAPLIAPLEIKII